MKSNKIKTQPSKKLVFNVETSGKADGTNSSVDSFYGSSFQLKDNFFFFFGLDDPELVGKVIPSYLVTKITIEELK